MTDIASILRAIRDINQCPEGFLPLHAPIFCGNEQKYVADTINSTFVSSVGEYVNRLESMLQKVTGVRHAVACVNGTSALQVALHLAGVRSGDWVIIPSLTFVATANAVAHCGAEPIFLDIDRETLGLSPQAIRDFLQQHAPQGRYQGRRIAAIVPMHCFGFPCSMDELLAIATEWNIPIVEDAAEALGSDYKSHPCGGLGQLGILSFNGNKIVTTGGGGAILTDDPELARQAKHLTTTAKLPHAWEFRHDAVAWNFRLPNINAALGCAQLEQLDFFVTEKRQRAHAYQTFFADTDWEFLTEPADTCSNYWLCSVLLPDRHQRDAFLQASNAAGVMTRPAWEPLHTLPIYASCPHDALSITTQIADRLVNLPSGVRTCPV